MRNIDVFEGVQFGGENMDVDVCQLVELLHRHGVRDVFAREKGAKDVFEYLFREHAFAIHDVKDGCQIDFEYVVPGAANDIVVQYAPFIIESDQYGHDGARGGAIKAFDVFQFPYFVLMSGLENTVESEAGYSAA